MDAHSKHSGHGREPQLPAFLKRNAVPAVNLQIQSGILESLLSDLCGELGLDRQETSLRWLLEQLETSHDLRSLILVLLQKGDV